MKKFEKQKKGKIENMENKLNQYEIQKGITLIALVVTIVVLLILAGITINLVLADGGIFGKAEEASEAQKKAEVEDKVGLILADALVEKATYGTKLKEYLQKENILIVAEDDETIMIEVDGYTVVIDKETIEIISIDKNGKSVIISIAETAKLNEEIEAKISLGSEMKIIGWAYTTDETLAADTSNFPGTYDNSGVIRVTGTSQTTYYLHLLVEDSEGNQEVKRSTKGVKVGNYVESISLDKTEITLDVGGTETLVATALPSDANNTNVNWKSSNEGVAKVSSTNTASGTAVTVTAIGAGTAVITAEAADGSEKSVSCKVTVARSGNVALDPNKYTWEVMNKIAKEISDNYGTGEGQYNKATERVQLTIEGEEYDIMAGDTLLLIDTSNNSYTVRILGFNHDKLTNPKAYNSEETDTTVYAGISFEFVSFLTYKKMNTSFTNANGWAAMQMRKDLNGYTTADAAQSGEIAGLGATLTNKTYIKQVEKKYIKTYSSASSVTTSSDYLWLLSTSEIWNNGYTTRAYGYAITGANESTMYETNDTQTQYKYYAKNLGNTAYSATTNITKKPKTSSAMNWWLRSPHYHYSSYFCYVHGNGNCSYYGVENSYGVAPGFSI